MCILSWISENKDTITSIAAIISSFGVIFTLAITIVSKYIGKKYKEARNVGAYINANHKSKYKNLDPSMDEFDCMVPDPLICISNQNKLPMYEPIIHIKKENGNIINVVGFSIIIPATVSTVRLLEIISPRKNDDYNKILASIEFTDSNGKRWCRDFNGNLIQIKKHLTKIKCKKCWERILQKWKNS